MRLAVLQYRGAGCPAALWGWHLQCCEAGCLAVLCSKSIDLTAHACETSASPLAPATVVSSCDVALQTAFLLSICCPSGVHGGIRDRQCLYGVLLLVL